VPVKTHTRRRLYTVLVVFALFVVHTASAQRENYQLTQAQKLLFDTPHLSNLLAGDTVSYNYARSGTLEPAFEDRAELVIDAVLEDQRRSLETSFLSGERRIPFASGNGFHGNPLIMLFLERDAREMSRLTGGTATYFRNRIRHALAKPDVVTESVRVPFAGEEISGTRVELVPFSEDPLLDRFAAFAGKRYTFIVSAQMPGGIYRLESVAPPPTGNEPVIRETLLFNQVQATSTGDVTPAPPIPAAAPQSQSS